MVRMLTCVRLPAKNSGCGSFKPLTAGPRLARDMTCLTTWDGCGVPNVFCGAGQQRVVRILFVFAPSASRPLLARNSAKLETPRKPYLIKALIKNGWGGQGPPARGVGCRHMAEER